jgi:predicted ATPase/class 3 adenylate cyclase
MACPNCGEGNRRTATFCRNCGQTINQSAPLPPAVTSAPAPITYVPKHLSEKIFASRQALEGERKHVTVLFADIRGSTALIDGRDPEEAQKIIDPVLHLMMKAVHRYEGTVNQVLGDGIMALFGAPLAHEDHALRACYAALAMQEELQRHRHSLGQSEESGLQIGIGMNTGEVVVRSIDNDLNVEYSALGHTTHLAARMQELASASGILMTNSTLREVEGFVEVRPRGAVQAKGISRPVDAFELVGATTARTRVQAAGVRGLTPLVGREPEIAVFKKLIEQTAAGRGQVLAMVGEAGMGKSRLVHEFTRHQLPPGWLVLEAASVSYGKATPYFPLIVMLRRYFQIGDGEGSENIQERVVMHVLELDNTLRDTIAPTLSLLDELPNDEHLAPEHRQSWLSQQPDIALAIQRFNAMDPQQRRRHTLDAVKRLLIRESQRQPVLAVFEDLHWIDTETQAFLDGLIDSLPLARLLLLVNYRPGYSHSWGDKTFYTQLRVEPLQHSGAEELLGYLLGNNKDLIPLEQMLLVRTEGNPFFAEESVRSLVETGFLVGEKGAYRTGLKIESIHIPSTVQNVVADRIDRLPVDEKHLLQTAAVVGVAVPYPLLRAVAELSEDTLNLCLGHLQAAEFLYESNLFPELEYTFKHALITEVAYGALLHERRTWLHSNVMTALEKVEGATSHDHVEKLARHAFHGELWDKAVTYLRQTGSKAMGRSAYREAAACLDRALISLKKLPSNRQNLERMIDLRLDFRNALFPLEELDRVIEHLRAAETLAESLGDKRRLGRIYGYLVHFFTLIGDRKQATVASLKGLNLARGLADSSIQIELNYYVGRAHYYAGDYDEAIELHKRNIESLGGEKIHDRFDMECPPSILCRVFLVMCLAEIGELSSAIKYGTEALQIANEMEHSFGAVYADSALGIAHIRKGELDAAIAVLERGLERCRTADIPVQFPLVASPLGLAYTRTGRIVEGISLLEQAVEQTASKRISGQAFRVAWLSEAYLRADRVSEASAQAELALELARKYQEKGREAWILRLLGLIHDRQNPADTATVESYFRQALERAIQFKMRPLEAHCRFNLGELYGRLGDKDNARSQLRNAIDSFRAMEMIAPFKAAAEALAKFPTRDP